MNEEFHVCWKGQTLGPFTRQEIERQLLSGEITPLHAIRRDGELIDASRWLHSLRASKSPALHDFAGESLAPPPPPPPPAAFPLNATIEELNPTPPAFVDTNAAPPTAPVSTLTPPPQSYLASFQWEDLFQKFKGIYLSQEEFPKSEKFAENLKVSSSQLVSQPSTMNIYIYKNEQQLGPFDEPQIVNGIQEGEFSFDDFAWKEGSTDWVRLEELLQKDRAIPSTPIVKNSGTSTFIKTNVKQGVLIAGWVCLGLGIATMYFSHRAIFIYTLLFLAAFILGIILMSRKSVKSGIFLLLGTIILPSMTGIFLYLKHEPQLIANLIKLKISQPAMSESKEEPAMAEIKGEVFISTQGGDTKKLSGILIRFYKREKLQKNLAESAQSADAAMPPYDQEIEKAQEQILSAQKQLQEALGLSQYDPSLPQLAQRNLDNCKSLKAMHEYYKASWPHASYYFNLLPKAEYETRTDSDGNFSINLPNKNWIMVADTNRKVGKSEEFYYWTYPAKTDSINILSNYNLVTSNNSESILKTVVGKAQ